MTISTHDILLSLYNEFPLNLQTVFQSEIFKDAAIEEEYFALKETKEWLDNFFPKQNPSETCIEKIMQFAANKNYS